LLAPSPSRNGEGDQPQAGGGDPASLIAFAEAEAGMAEMSGKFREKGSEVYVAAETLLQGATDG
jgi:phosphomethylpyrimidine synthase